MTLFTAEGLIRAWVREQLKGICHAPSVVHHAYLRWLLTQGEQPRNADVPHAQDGWLIGTKALWSQRAPGNTCLGALRATPALGTPARNDSKGCGGVMRVAPAGLIGSMVDDPFELGSDLAHLTHGHPSGYLAAGHLASTLTAIMRGADLKAALDAGDADLDRHEDAGEVRAALDLAREAAFRSRGDAVPAELGEGWVAEEALAIAVWCALVADDPVEVVILAVNHDGDSDSTGSIAGQIVGALQGSGAWPEGWLGQLEMRGEIERLAQDLSIVVDAAGLNAQNLWDDYPGW